MKVSLLTLGCKVNQAEMSDIENTLRGQGHDIVTLGDNPDVCVVNTCTVTSKSDYQSRQLIRRAGRTGAKVIVTGCYSELNRDKVGRMEGVQAVVENANKINIINMIGGNIKRDKPLVRRGRTRSRTRYFLKVQDGCNNSCSYCIVHIARGPSRSVTPRKIIENVKKAVDGGYREVVLTGIHLGQYGTDLDGGTSVSGIVEDIIEKTSIERLRLSSLEINEIDDRLLELFKNSRLMPHLHIPLQSGDDETLKLMNRAYDTAFFRETIMQVHERLPEIALGTDIIAGFPSETGRASDNTLALVEVLPFTYMHIFPYSRRPGTPAAEMEDIVGHTERKRRAQALRTLSQKKKSAYMNRQTGKTLGVLLEETVKDGLCLGTSSNYLKVEVPCGARMRGTIVPVRIAGAREGKLVGELANSQEPFDIMGKTVCTKPVQ
jgi:threonylcarbamoyladenosine tRNA methylthiotransferase MtaB